MSFYMQKKILIISNEPLSDASANGRTMKNMLLNFPRENLAQFYLHGIPDTDACGSFFRVTDRDALNAFLHKKETSKHPKPSAARNGSRETAHYRPVRSYRNLVLRNLVWQSMRWWTKDFSAFLEAFSPDIVLLQAGDAPFMYKIARRIAKKYHAGLVMFNTEHYVLKKVMYAYSGENLFWHNILMQSLKKQYGKFMRFADYCIYNTQALETAYQEAYPHPGKSAVLYTTSTMEQLPDESGAVFSLMYCGNLGAGRCVPVQEMADVLFAVDPEARLDIYGKFPSQAEQDAVCKKANVCYHGFVDYSELMPRMREATMLIHCENKDRVENLKYAFSTKIADSLASGKPFLVYASGEYPFVQYLAENRCAHLAGNPEELKTVLEKCKKCKEYRNQYTDQARLIAEQNHSREKNCQEIGRIFNLI